MTRWFNTTGPCNPSKHYMLPATTRLPGVREVVDREGYFVVHAPRQSGKTTAFIQLAQELTREGHYAAVLVSAEVGAPFPADPGAAELAVLGAFRMAAEVHLPAELRPPPWPAGEPGERLARGLKEWASACPRPLVLFIDEIDALRDEALVSGLRQLRTGFQWRPVHFPSSIGLIGLRDVRDYVVASGGSGRLGTASPFNISVRSFTLAEFTRDEIATLYGQHTADTAQGFAPEAIDRAFALTRGQPWLVNALASRLVDELVLDRARTITAEDVDRARDVLISRQDSHLDSLAERLREPRVRQVIEPILAGTQLGDLPEDDRQFAVDLGLVRRTSGGLEIANLIYKEVIPRVLANNARDSLPAMTPTWLDASGRLDTTRLLEAFLTFWRQHGEPLLRTAHYHEIAPHLVLMAFLHRVVNGGGSIEREYAIGSGRMDLLVRLGDARLAIELKVWRDDEQDPRAQGLEQLDAYLAGLGLNEGWLVVFDRRAGQSRISERTTTCAETTPKGRAVQLIRA